MTKFEQLKTILKENIHGGIYGAGDKIPTEPELVKQYRIGRNTVREAVSSLVHEGLLKKVQGRGTFVTSESDASFSRRGGQIGLASFIRLETIRLFNYVQDYVLDQGGLLTFYNVNEDNQDPAKEKRFLEKAEQENFSGLIVLPSPLEPMNTSLYKRLRDKGIKVALIDSYKEDMTGEVSFLCDYYHAGYMATAKIAMAGYKYVMLARELMPICYQLMRNGMMQAAADFGLNQLEDLYYSSKECCSKQLLELPEDTAILTTQTSIGYNIYDELISLDMKPGESVGLCMRKDYERDDKPQISCLISPQFEQLKAAIDYIFDDRTPATDIIKQTFKFNYEEHGTIER